MLLRASWNNPAELDQIESWLALRNQAFTRLQSNGHAKAPTLWQPAVDVHENAERILLVADLPGLEQSDIEISIDKNVLTVRGERKRELSEEHGSHSFERVQGHFSRAFTLPPTVDLDKVSADMKAGVLTMTLLKKAEAKPRQIKINVAAS